MTSNIIIEAPPAASPKPNVRPACFSCKKQVIRRGPGDVIGGVAVYFHVACWERWRAGEEPRS